MPSAHTLLAFALLATVFVAIPGPSNLYVLVRGIQSGSRAAVAGAAGCATGAFTYVVATAAGLLAGGLRGDPLRRRGLPVLAGHLRAALACAGAAAGGGRPAIAMAQLPPGRARRARQPEGRAVLPRPVPAVHPRRLRSGRPAGRHPRLDLRLGRLRLRLAVRARLGPPARAPGAPPAPAPRPAPRHRPALPRPRRVGRGLRDRLARPGAARTSSSRGGGRRRAASASAGRPRAGSRPSRPPAATRGCRDR
jgi:hypothetical protein